MPNPPAPAFTQPAHAGRTPRAIFAFLLGCAQAFAWLVLIFLEQLAERWTGIDGGDVLSGGWYFALVGGVALMVVLGLTLPRRRHYVKLRPLAWLLLGWMAVGVLFVLFVVWAVSEGLPPPVGAG